MNKIIQLLSICLFILFLLSPLVQMKFAFASYSQVTENRKRAERPQNIASLLLDRSTDYAKKFEAYFNDNYGFRDFLIRVKNQLDYSLFGVSSEVVIGPKNWLFYKSVLETEEVMLERASPADIDVAFSRLGKLNEYLKKKGITMVVIPCPQKNTIYPEWVPSNTARRPDVTLFQKYRSYLYSHPEIKWIDAQDILMKNKESFQLYYKTDFHWVDPAGFLVARELVNKIGEWSGTNVSWTRPLKLESSEPFSTGGQNNSLAILYPYLEVAPQLVRFPLEQFGKYTDTALNQWTYISNQTESALLPPTVIFGDSYSDAYKRSGYADYFSKLHRYHFHDLKKLLGSIPEDTQFLVMSHIEVGMLVMFVKDYWPEEIGL